MILLLALLGYAVLAAFTAPLLLSRGSWRIRFPRLALRLWLLAFGSGVLALLATLVWSVALVIGTHSDRTVPSGWFGPTAIVVFAWVGLAVFGGVLGVVISRAEPIDASKRRAHQQLVLLEATSSYDRTLVAGIAVNFVECTAPLAMSLAGEDRRIVVTSRLHDELTPTQLRSVIEHERAHLTHHHGLVASISKLNLACLPKFLGAREFERSTHLLIELIADDSAAHVCGVVDAANALLRVGHLRGSEAMELRAERLVDNSSRLPARSVRRLRSAASFAGTIAHRQPGAASRGL